jgi:hypothetical protein
MLLTTLRRGGIGVIAAAAALALTIAVAPPAQAGRDPHHSRWRAIAAGAEPQSNPLKGFIPFAGDYSTFPHSMEWSYFPLNAVMTAPATFDWSAVDVTLNQIAARGHQTAMRFYLDYPGRTSGIPQFLLDGGLVTHSYTEFDNTTSVIPDYNDPKLLAAIDQFAAALGTRYDGDPRLGFLQVGLIGFWGEWHTWPYNGDGYPDYMPTEANQARVLGDFLSAFDKTELEVRYATSTNASLDVGYHDDSFALSTKPSSYGWYFMDQVIAAGATEKWKTNSIGGELRPELQSCIFSTAGCPVVEEGGDNDFPGSVAVTHASWLINHYAFATGYTGADKARAIAGAQSLGYSFRVKAASIPWVKRARDGLDLAVKIQNVGIAPFYYHWTFSVGLADARGRIVRSWPTSWGLDQIASGAEARFDGAFSTAGLKSGRYSVVLQGTNPLATGQPVRFANAGQDATVKGWLSLGSTILVR